jgi:hypothetical protein
MSDKKLNEAEYLARVKDDVLLQILAGIAERGMKFEAVLLAAALGLRLERRAPKPQPTVPVM